MDRDPFPEKKLELIPSPVSHLSIHLERRRYKALELKYLEGIKMKSILGKSLICNRVLQVAKDAAKFIFNCWTFFGYLCSGNIETYA